MKVKLLLSCSLFFFFGMLLTNSAVAQSADQDVNALTQKVFAAIQDDVKTPPAASLELSVQDANGKVDAAVINISLRKSTCPSGYYCRNGFCISYSNTGYCKSNEDCPATDPVQICIDDTCHYLGEMCE